MTVYGNPDGFFGRYPQIATKVTSADVSSVYLPSASEWVERSLARMFTLPFTSTNATAKELTYTRALLVHRLRTTNPDDSKELAEDLKESIAALLDGSAAMTFETSAAPIFAGPVFTLPQYAPFGTHADFEPTFSMDDTVNQQVDPDMLSFERTRRGITSPGSA